MYRASYDAESAAIAGGTPAHRFSLDPALDHIAHWLPAQRPIKDFVHHNTLHAVQDRPFHEGVALAAKIFGAHSYLPLADYQARHRSGRIGAFAIDWAVARAESDPVKRDALRRSLFEPDQTVHYPPVSLANHGIRERWLTHIGLNLNALVQPILFRLTANFLDQGISRWTVAQAGESFWDCVWRLVEGGFIPLYPFQEPEARAAINQTPDAAIRACLARIVGDESLYEQYLLEMLLAHPGWAGMVRVIETAPDALLARRRITLKEFIALELALELAFLRGKRGADCIPVAATPGLDQVDRLADALARPVVPLRLKVWHEAMEFSLYAELLRALPAKGGTAKTPTATAPTAQALFCLDDRECSLRRHLEELDPRIATYGAAGFFGIDFLYKGIDDAYPVAQCPVVVTPRHLVVESAVNPAEAKKKPIQTDFSKLHLKSNSALRGWIFTQALGLGYAARLAFEVFRPGSKLPKIKHLGEIDAHTELHLLRESDEPDEQGRFLGFSYGEMADKLEGILRTIGLTHGFAPLVVVVAHGSSSVNNPHFAAYDCGACSGKPGAPNARAFAQMANDGIVRGLLRERGIDIPDATRFVAALHNTSRDEIQYFDQHTWEREPQGWAAFRATMAEALRRNAHERCRWFELGPQGADPELSHQHVQSRATSIFEPRPELNHSNNLYCVVGRRRLTADLFLDRRAFLHSYDPDSDPEGDILLRILNAIIPVCGGINLEYLFSRVDNSVYGAGTKLPHNVIGLLGVANGVDGDLRTGLPSQMIEVHEPARLLIVIEQSPKVIHAAYQRLGALQEWLDNEWVRLVSCHPDTRETLLYTPHGWEPLDLPTDIPVPQAACSLDIFPGHTRTIPVHRLVKESV
ncbi:YbcC family protein [Methylomagnum ishizawai]|uniref:YbcC family protein n=1 Tax=Methylomagnum ishizawai TaxID=1760988 RepID=UPI001C32D472|nr:DUF2309 domain-containing protein [Methylomagnum ishizawai]BBL75848.1 hypothetical protein MishRS11D_29460 [Methylomagnum ishizawai]